MSIKNKKLVKIILSFVLAITMFSIPLALGGCNDKGRDVVENESSKNNKMNSKAENIDFGKLGFITDFVIVADTRVVGDADSRAYVLKNENNQLYVLTGFYEHRSLGGTGNPIGGTFEIVKLSNEFDAYRIYQCIDYKDNTNHGGVGDNDVFFYIKGGLEGNDFYKCTIHRGKYVDGEVVEKNSVKCEKIDIPGKVINFQSYENQANFALNDKGEVYAWNNTLKESEYSDSVEDNITGFSDGKRHDTPTKLPISDIKDMCSLGESSGRVYLTNSGEVYVKETGEDFRMLENISNLEYIYAVDDTNAHEFIGINNKSEIELYKVGKLVSGKEQSALSSVKAESPIPSSNYCYYRKEADGTNNTKCDIKYYTFKTNSPAHGTEYYWYNHGIKLCEYYNIPDNTTTPINISADYISMYGDTWFDKSGNLYWYNSLNKNEDYILASDVKEYVICDKNAYLRPEFVEAQVSEEVVSLDKIKFIYHKDGSVQMFASNSNASFTKLIDLDPLYYGNGTFGTLIPGDNGKYKICNQMSKDGSYDVIQEIELPE